MPTANIESVHFSNYSSCSTRVSGGILVVSFNLLLVRAGTTASTEESYESESMANIIKGFMYIMGLSNRYCRVVIRETSPPPLGLLSGAVLTFCLNTTTQGLVPPTAEEDRFIDFGMDRHFYYHWGVATQSAISLLTRDNERAQSCFGKCSFIPLGAINQCVCALPF